MNQAISVKDLVVLVADFEQEKTIATLLETRCPSLRIQPPVFEIFRHPGHDPGIYVGGGDFMSVLIAQLRYALILLEAEWKGSPGNSAVIATKIQQDLDTRGWRDRSAVIVCDPELEVWVWSDSPHVPEALDTTWETIRALAETNDYWTRGAAKPTRPKELLEEILFQTNKRRSAALYAQLARTVGLERCQDTAFRELRRVLQAWFPLAPSSRVVRERRATYRRKKTG